MIDFLWVVLGIAVVATALYFAATLLFGPGEPPPPAAVEPPVPLPADRALTADDLRAAELPVGARGYRMSDVDALLERLAQQLEEAAPPSEAGPAAHEDAVHGPDQRPDKTQA